MKDSELAERIMTPDDCVFALALPTTSEDFYTDCGNGRFAASYRIWERYRQEVAKPALRLLPRMENLGATVVRRATLAALGQLFQKEFPVIILMAHWQKTGAIELADGLAGVDAVLGQIPRDAVRILDLGACQPWPLTFAVRRDRPGCLVRMTDADATPAIWLNFYHFVLHQLRHERRTYLRAVEDVVCEVRKRTHVRKNRKHPP